MSAAATAAGYLYASGRLRNRGSQEHEQAAQAKKEKVRPGERTVRVAVLPEPGEARAAKPRRVPKIAYRTRRWKPE